MTEQHIVVGDDIHAAVKSAAAEVKLDIRTFTEKWMLTNPEVKTAYKRITK